MGWTDKNGHDMKKEERQLDNEKENYRDVQTLITKCLFQGAFEKYWHD